MNVIDAQIVLNNVRFPGYRFQIHGNFDATQGFTYLQAVFMAADNTASCIPSFQEHRTRKWLLSQHMTVSELVQTAFKCVLASIEHEAREQFTYKKARVFGPHFLVDDLVGLCLAGKSEAGARA